MIPSNETQVLLQQPNLKFPWHSGVCVVKAASSVLAVYKPCGIASHPNACANRSQQILMEAPYDEEKEAYKVGEGYIYLLNRLDSPTSGLLLLSTDYTTAQSIRALFREHCIQKTYHAVVKGYFPENPLNWHDRLDIRHHNTYVRTYCTKNCGMWAKTRARLLKIINFQNETLSFIELTPLTGRTHQLRVQCASRGFPILGDRTYGNFAWNKRLKAERLYLHAEKISFELPNLTFEAECPSRWDLGNE